MTLVAKRKINLEGKLYRAGEPVDTDGLSKTRVEHLTGRFLMPAADFETAPEDGGSGDVELDDMTVAQLDAFAAELGIDLPAGANKAQKLEVIKAATEAAE